MSQDLSSFLVALIQIECSEDSRKNLEKVISTISQTATIGAKVICLPELFRSRYFCQREAPQNFDLAESIPGPTTEALGKIAREREIVIVAPIFERRAAGVYHNSAAVIDVDGKIAGLYRKMHIPDDPGYYEKYYFTPGDLGFRVIKTAVANLGVLICWDQWFPEGARLAALQGAEVLIYPTAIGWHPDEKAQHGAAQLDAWRTIQRSHAVANGIYVVTVNRVGHEIPAAGGPGIEFWGHSFVSDPFGVVISEAGSNQEHTLVVEIRRKYMEEVRRHWPFLRDRRIDAYQDLTQRWIDPRP